MMKARLVIRVVACMTERSIGIEKRPLTIVRISPPAAPTDAASVGEAMPAKIEPSTPTISTSAGISARTTRLNASPRKAASSSAGMGGARCGFTWERITR